MLRTRWILVPFLFTLCLLVGFQAPSHAAYYSANGWGSAMMADNTAVSFNINAWSADIWSGGSIVISSSHVQFSGDVTSATMTKSTAVVHFTGTFVTATKTTVDADAVIKLHVVNGKWYFSAVIRSVNNPHGPPLMVTGLDANVHLDILPVAVGSLVIHA